MSGRSHRGETEPRSVSVDVGRYVDSTGNGDTRIKRILVVDDDRDIITTYKALLSKRYYVIGAYTGEEAVEKYKEYKPHLVLMDIIMPVKSGDRAIREIKALDSRANIIAFSAYEFDEKELGVKVIKKSIEQKDLMKLIEQTLMK